jgi:hypothetical protein
MIFFYHCPSLKVLSLTHCHIINMKLFQYEILPMLKLNCLTLRKINNLETTTGTENVSCLVFDSCLGVKQFVKPKMKQSLSLIYEPITKIPSYYSHLTELLIQDCHHRELSTVETLSNIRKLTLRNVSSLRIFSHLTNTMRLYILKCDKLERVLFLSNISLLIVTNCPIDVDISFLHNVRNIMVSNPKPLEKILENLEQLDESEKKNEKVVIDHICRFNVVYFIDFCEFVMMLYCRRSFRSFR